MSDAETKENGPAVVEKDPARFPFVAYDEDGNAHRYRTALDANQACDLAGYTLHPPGTDPRTSTQKRVNYNQLSSEAIVKLCVQRSIRGYMTMNRDQQIQALEDRDEEDARALLKGKARRELSKDEHYEAVANKVTDKLPVLSDAEGPDRNEPEADVDDSFEALKAEADKLGVKYPANIKAETLKKKIEAAKASPEPAEGAESENENTTVTA